MQIVGSLLHELFLSLIEHAVSYLVEIALGVLVVRIAKIWNSCLTWLVVSEARSCSILLIREGPCLRPGFCSLPWRWLFEFIGRIGFQNIGVLFFIVHSLHELFICKHLLFSLVSISKLSRLFAHLWHLRHDL